MRQLLKIIFALVLAPILVASTAFGQNTVDIKQTNATASWTQTEGNGSNTIAGINGPYADPAVSHTFDQVTESELNAIQTVNGGGAKHELYGEQTGGGNHLMDTKQNGFSGQRASILQTDGTDHEAQLRQFTSSSGVTGNRADVVQTQSNNLLKGPRFASDNRLGFQESTSRRAPQLGVRNILQLRQRGGVNQLFAEQVGDGVREGSNNKIRLTQRGGAYAEISQRGSQNCVANNSGCNSTLPSDGSDLFVRQQGHGNIVYGSQTASGSSATIDQSMGSTAQSRQIP